MNLSSKIPLAAVSVAALGLLAAPFPAIADDVPDALSVEWKGEKPCEKLFEDAEVRVAGCTFSPGATRVFHFSNNSVPRSELSALFETMHAAVKRLAEKGVVAPAVTEPPPGEPAVSIRKSVTPDYLICLDDGRKFKSLRRPMAQADVLEASEAGRTFLVAKLAAIPFWRPIGAFIDS